MNVEKFAPIFITIPRIGFDASGQSDSANGPFTTKCTSANWGNRPTQPAGRNTPRDKEGLAFIIKWLASIIQITGYTATGFGWTPWNVYLFLVGVAGWLIVGVLWKDRAIMLIHVIALGAMVAGISSS